MKEKLNLYLQIHLRIIYVVLMLCFSSYGFGQADVNLRLDFSPDSVRIGQPLNLQMQLSIPENGVVNHIQFFPDSIKVLARAFQDSSAVEYEFQDYGSFSVANEYKFLPAQLNWKGSSNGSVKLFQNQLKLFVWEPGVFVFPAAKVEVALETGVYDVYSNEVRFTIGLADDAKVSTVDSMGLAPIKSIIREDAKSYWSLILGILFALGALIAGFYYYFSKQKAKPIPPPIPISAHEKALTALAGIEKKRDWEKGLLKKYYDELTLVIRRYFEDRYGVKALESTSDEFIRDLKSIGIEDAWKVELKRLLPMADLVKFAKANPEQEEHTTWLKWAKDLIHATKDISNGNYNEIEDIQKISFSVVRQLRNRRKQTWRSVAIFSNEFHFSSSKLNTQEEFEKNISRPALLRSVVSVPLSSIKELQFNEVKQELYVWYLNKKGKRKKKTLIFANPTEADDFGQILGEQAGLQKVIQDENKTWPLLANAGGILLTGMFLLMLLFTPEVFTEVSETGSRRSRGNSAVLKIIYETLGPTVLMLVCVGFIFFFGYRMYQRFKNPAKETHYLPFKNLEL